MAKPAHLKNVTNSQMIYFVRKLTKNGSLIQLKLVFKSERERPSII